MRIRTVQVMLIALGLVASIGPAHVLAENSKASVVPQSLVGCWSRHVPALPVGTSAGVWLVRIQSSGAFAAYAPGSTRCNAKWDFTSKIDVKGARLTIGHVPICSTNGLYALTATRKTLSLRVVSDKLCAARVGLLAGTWKRTS